MYRVLIGAISQIIAEDEKQSIAVASRSVSRSKSYTRAIVNEQFVKNAPPAIVEGARARQAELRARIEKLLQNE